MSVGSRYNNFKTIAKDALTIYRGFKTLKKTKRTPESAYLSMRQLFVKTNGKSNDLISRLVSRKGYPNIDIKGVLGLSSSHDLKRVVNDIKANGYYVFDQKLSEEQVNEIYNYALKTPCSYLDIKGDQKNYSKQLILFDEKAPVSPRYEFNSEQILECETLRELIFDTSILAVAQEYLGTKPILDLLAMWWSAPFQGVAKSEAAQMYHFDLDRIKFLKFFFYITDVDTSTGPHCYVRKSHSKLPETLLKDGRLTDQEVEAAFGKENMVEIGGKRGTIIAVDTRGLHKGKDLVEGKRLLFQIEFSNCMFGQYYPPANKPVLNDLLERRYQDYKDTYSEIIT